MSILDPVTCGFAKVFAYELLVENNNALGKGLAKTNTSNCLLDLHKRFVFLFLLIYHTSC